MRDQQAYPTALARVLALAGPDATVRDTRRLAGGMHARTFLIRTTAPERDFILREFDPGDDAARREIQVLNALDGLGGQVPRLLAGEPDGRLPEGPWTLISRLPGAADITPGDPSSWARQLGRALARLHATDLGGLAGFPSLLSRPAGSPAALSGPVAGLVAARWDAVTGGPAVLTHYDFWSGNTVWQDGTLTGVVDWPGGALGPPAFDIGWGRLDLFLLFGERIADTFSDSYPMAAPDVLLCDLWAAARSHQIVELWAPSYRDLGRGDLTAPVLRQRHTAWTRRLMERSGG